MTTNEAKEFATRLHNVGGWTPGRLTWKEVRIRVAMNGRQKYDSAVSVVHAEVVSDGKGNESLVLHEQHPSDPNKMVPALSGPIAAFKEDGAALEVNLDIPGVQLMESRL